MPVGPAAVLAEWGAALFSRGGETEEWTLQTPHPEWLKRYFHRSSDFEPSELFYFYPAFEPEAEEAWSLGGSAVSPTFMESSGTADTPPRLQMTALWVEGQHVLIVHQVGEAFRDHEVRLQLLRDQAIREVVGDQISLLAAVQNAVVALPESRRPTIDSESLEGGTIVADPAVLQQSLLALLDVSTLLSPSVKVTLAFPSLVITGSEPLTRSQAFKCVEAHIETELAVFGVVASTTNHTIELSFPLLRSSNTEDSSG